MLEKCPHCGGTEGYGVRYVESLERLCQWNGAYEMTTEGMAVSNSKTAHCIECGKGIRVSTLDRLNAE